MTKATSSPPHSQVLNPQHPTWLSGSVEVAMPELPLVTQPKREEDARCADRQRVISPCCHVDDACALQPWYHSWPLATLYPCAMPKALQDREGAREAEAAWPHVSSAPAAVTAAACRSPMTARATDAPTGPAANHL
eukprot:CAMPEP_0118923280 /NCGR_PEP_ID=MMETSP1169-20130426/1866_1 /TAXON_ID=36882 /ORGANISM="Pyramimonas obovata, Strain CCMP722" /LENGTH=135 /DNA_ID=CAMNT_0006864247 /DNA_START=634 /DNA_END=1042 /DNA_ORIENTATION=-